MQFDLFSTPRDTPKNFVIYRSSAGSGKTYTLTREYLTLALQSPQYFRSILAVTFTNKATQEMKTRIIETLHELSVGTGTPIRQELQEATGLTKEQLQERAQQVLSAILHNYSYFAVSTIDSFFQTVIRAFAREVGLQAGFKVELEQDKVLEDLIDLLLKDVEKDKRLLNWLIQYATDRVDEGYTWDIRQDIKNLANEIFREDFKRHEGKLQAIARDSDRFMFFLKQLKELRQGFEQRMKTIGEDALKIMADYGLQFADFSSGTSGVAGYFLNILPEKGKYEPGARALGALHAVEKWYTKTSKKKEIIEAAVLSGGLNEKLQQALELYQNEYTKYNTAKQLLRFVYTFGILASLTDKLRQYREDHDLMLISDAAVFLREIIGQNDAPFIYEKTGSSYQHFLIDEFQDTSGFQWDNFKPLVVNSVAAGNYNLVVGDTKQSIYRWRGGDWQLLLNQVELDIGREQTKNVELSHNWRSCREIIAFNNQTFFHAAEAVQELYLEKVSDIDDEAEEQVLHFEARQIAEAYKDVFQHFPDIKAPNARCGHIHIGFLPKSGAAEDEEDEEAAGGWKAQAQQKLLRTVEMLQDRGYRLKDIALLVRTKGEGKELADALMEAEETKAPDCPYHYRVVSNESLYVDSAASVCLLLNILRYMNNPQDVVARASMIHDYQRYILGREDADLHHLFRFSGSKENREENKYEQFLPESFLEKRPYLNKLPLYELMENLILEFNLHKIRGEWAYLQAFQDAVLSFTKTERGDIDAFLEWWTETGYKTSVQVSETLDAIRIYTIHTSKGLQFKAVIMPYCNWKLDHNTQFNNILWTEAEHKPFNKIEVMPIKYTSSLRQTIFRQAYYRELMKAYLDNLNLLYVAFTRAEEALFAWTPLPTFEKKSGLAKADEINGLLYRLLSEQFSIEGEPVRQAVKELNFAHFWQPENHTFELGQLEQAKHKEESSELKQISLQHYFSQRWRNRLAVKKRSGSLTYTKAGESAAALDWNQTIYTILSKLEYRDDLPQLLDESYFEGLINREEQQVVRQKIEALLADTRIAGWFSPTWKVRNALPILVKEGFITRPDRVLSQDKTAIAIDFKIGEQLEEHQKRVKLYASLLKRMQYQQIEGYLLYLDSGELIQVV